MTTRARSTAPPARPAPAPAPALPAPAPAAPSSIQLTATRYAYASRRQSVPYPRLLLGANRDLENALPYLAAARCGARLLVSSRALH